MPTLTKTFSIRTAWLNLPKGESPDSPENMKRLSRLLQGMIPGAEHVEVDFARNANDQPLLDTMYVTAECSPIFGKMISTAGIDDAAAKALAEVIKALAGDQDASQAIQKLQEAAKGGGADPSADPFGDKDPSAEPKKPPFGGDDEDGTPPGAGPKPPGAPGAGIGDAPTGPPAKKKLPFARKRAGTLRRAADVAKEYEVSLGDATQVVRTIDEAESFDDALEDLKETFVDENGEPHEMGTYARLAWVARGRKQADLQELGITEVAAPLG